MAGYINSHRANINRILPKLQRSLNVNPEFIEFNTSFQIKLTHDGKIDGIDSILIFEVTVELLKDETMENFVSFFNNHTLSVRVQLKSKRNTHEMAIWHLDTENKQFNLMHPKYHFQYGGILAKTFDRKCYNTPRLSSSPVDYLAAIDFFVSNFFEEEKAQTFRKDVEYVNALRASQNDILKNYYDLMNRYYTSNVSNEEKDIVKKLIPTLLSPKKPIK
jgi:hypothetical protein